MTRSCLLYAVFLWLRFQNLCRLIYFGKGLSLVQVGHLIVLEQVFLKGPINDIPCMCFIVEKVSLAFEKTEHLLDKIVNTLTSLDSIYKYAIESILMVHCIRLLAPLWNRKKIIFLIYF